MTTVTPSQSPTTYPESGAAHGTTIRFENIQEPGCYVCNWSGHLLRVPGDAIAPGRSPLVSLTGNGPLFVTKISENPFIPVTKAKMIASNFDCNVNF